MFAEQVPLDYYAGNYRQVDADRPCLNTDVQVAGIPGVPAARVLFEVERLFAELRRHLTRFELSWATLSPRERRTRLAIILGALIGRFIQVHPFVNGNGRISRLVWAWGLIRFNVPPQVRIRKHPEDPEYDHVMASAMTGDFAPLALYILEHMVVATPPTLISPEQ